MVRRRQHDPTHAHTRWWTKRQPSALASTNVCLKCKTRGPERLYPGQVCASCEAHDAWSRLGAAGRMVIDRATIEAAVRRRRGEASGGPLWQRVLVWAIPAVTLGSAAVAACYLVDLLAIWGPHPVLVSVVVRQTMMMGFLSLILGAVALVHVQHSRHFRRLAFSVSHFIAIVVGGATVVVAALYWIAVGTGR